MFIALTVIANSTVASCKDDSDLAYYCSARALPVWMDENRIQGHVGLYNFTHKSDKQVEIGELVKLGLPVYTRHTKLDWRPPIWPSSVPSDHSGEPVLQTYPDHLAELVSEANKFNIKLIGYYYDAAEGVPFGVDRDKLVANHVSYNWSPPSQWLCKDLHGELVPVEQRRGQPFRGYHLDLSSEYKEFLLTRLIEMVDRGVSAIYFDERHYPKVGKSACFGSALESRYKNAGNPMPSKGLGAEHLRQYVEFQAQAMAEVFNYLRVKIAEARPDKVVPLIVSTTYLASYIEPHMSLQLGSSIDIAKVEYSHGTRRSINGSIFKKHQTLRKPPVDISLVSGWMIPRDSADGRPIHLWHSWFDNIGTMRSYIATGQAYGAINAINIPPKFLMGDRGTRKTIAGNKTTEYELLKEGIAYGISVAKHMRFTRPYTQYGVLLSDLQRVGFNSNKSVWVGQLAFVNAIVEVFVRNGLPIRIVTDADLRNKNSKDRYTKIFMSSAGLDSRVRRLMDEHVGIEQFAIIDNTNALAFRKSFSDAYDALEALVISETESTFDVQVDMKANLRRKRHAVFHRRIDTGVTTVTVVDRPVLLNKKYEVQQPEGARVLFRKKPSLVKSLLQDSILDVNSDAVGVYFVDIPKFDEIAILDVEF